MSHTALPWKVVENAHRLIESSVTLDTVANAIVLGNYVKQGMSIKQAIDKAAENAEFIVTAVNAYEALTQRVTELEEALRKTLELLEFHEGSAKPEREGGNPVIWVNGQDWADLLAEVRKVRP